MHRSEGVLAEQISQLRQPGRQVRFVGGLPGMEPGVLEKEHVSRSGPTNRPGHLSPHQGRQMENRKTPPTPPNAGPRVRG